MARVPFPDILLALDRRTFVSATAGTALSLASQGGLMAATRASLPSIEFDFLLGKWNVRHRKLRERLKSSTEWFEFDGTLDVRPILAGSGNVDLNHLDDPGGPYEATSLRLYDQARREWSIYWIDERYPGLDTPLVGRFEGPVGRFFAHEQFEGRPIMIRFVYENLSEFYARWSQAFSLDAGASWEVNWIMEFTRVAHA